MTAIAERASIITHQAVADAPDLAPPQCPAERPPVEAGRGMVRRVLGLRRRGRLAAIILLIAAGLAIAASLVTRPVADTAAAARRLALGLALMFALSPATRSGYFAYPAGLSGWLALTGSVAAGPPLEIRRRQTHLALRVTPS